MSEILDGIMRNGHDNLIINVLYEMDIAFIEISTAKGYEAI